MSGILKELAIEELEGTLTKAGVRRFSKQLTKQCGVEKKPNLNQERITTSIFGWTRHTDCHHCTHKRLTPDR